MLNDTELATLRNRFKRDAELLMQATTPGDEKEKSKLRERHVWLTLSTHLNLFNNKAKKGKVSVTATEFCTIS